jgi:hypothetical protein
MPQDFADSALHFIRIFAILSVIVFTAVFGSVVSVRIYRFELDAGGLEDLLEESFGIVGFIEIVGGVHAVIVVGS